VARDWRGVLRKLSPKHRGTVLVSLLEARPGDRFLGLFPKYWNPVPSLSVKLLAHSPYAFRFFKEMERIPPTSLCGLPLPGLLLPKVAEEERKPGVLRVGCLVPPTSDANLNLLVGIAHYLSKAGVPLQFSLPLQGKLGAHLEAMARDLELGSYFTPLQGHGEIDLLLHAPMKAESFIPVLWLGGQGLATLSTDVPGIEELISDGHDGFILPVNEIRPLAELLVRLAEGSGLRASLGENLRNGLARRFPLDRLIGEYGKLLTEGTSFGRPPLAA
jgi:hypothetical protein